MLVGGVDICVRETVGEDYKQTMVRDTKIDRTKTWKIQRIDHCVLAKTYYGTKLVIPIHTRRIVV